MSASARVGQVLSGKKQPYGNFAHDVGLVRARLREPALGTFELVLALRGFAELGRPSGSAGAGAQADLDAAVAICRRARFERCDRADLERTARELAP